MPARVDPAVLTNDLFISYSHIDDRPWGAGQHRWVTEFHRSLDTRLGMLLGREARIWRDEKIAGNDELTERIITELRQSRLFLCVLSPRYLTSDWCTREIELFSEIASARSQNHLGRPLFKVVKTPITRGQEPSGIGDLLGYEFFRETVAGKIHEFYPTRDEHGEESQGFWGKVDSLAQEIRDCLRVTSADASVSTAGVTGAKTIYLAETTTDIKPARDKIRQELGQRGYRVVPAKSLPLSADELLREIETELGDACLTVHPVGGRYGFIPEGDSRSIVELQLDEATRKNGRAQHLIWVSPEALSAAEPRQKEFLEKLRHVYTEQHGTELLEQKPLEDLKTRLVEKLSVPKAMPHAPQQNRRIYLICDRSDLDTVKPWKEYLRAQGFSVQVPLIEGDEQEMRQDHQDTWVLCDAVLIYYGRARQAWLRAKHHDLWKAPGWGRTKPLLAQAILVAPPSSPEKDDYVNDEFLVLRGDASAVAMVLAPFVDQVRNVSGAAS